MLTLVETISLAGDRAKQNDDACGSAPGCAWVIDGATDLHEPPLTDAASDAAWIAHFANAWLHADASPGDEQHLRALVREASEQAADAYDRLVAERPANQWQWPLGSMLMTAENADGVIGLDLGDCRCFALDTDGAAYESGGPPKAADNETQLAARAASAAGDGPLLRHADTLDMLRRMRGFQNTPGGSWTFCLLPRCADEARVWTLRLKRPAHILLATDGFSAIVDRYAMYDAGGIVRAALDKGLQELGRELRAVETQDASGAKHPRWKRSDDATAVLVRLT